MSYVSIWKPVNERIVQASRETESEIIGLLLGRLENDAIIIDDSITGEFSAEPHRVTLPSATIAKIAHDFVNGRIKGNIVGWYHSHTEGGLFFSDTDSETQRKLQQFSSLITAMVIDSTTGDVGYFRIDPRTEKPIRIPSGKIRVFTEATEALREIPAKPPVRPTPTIEVRAAPTRPRQPTNLLIVATIVIALIVSLAILGTAFYRGIPTGPALTIIHTSISNATIGTPVEVRANVTGPVRNATLAYAVAGTASFTQAKMNSPGPGQYSYVIPGEQVTGNIAYFITATDTSGSQVRTVTYNIVISDFAFQAYNLALTVYRTRTAAAELRLLAINGFSQQVTLSTTGAPQGLTVSFTPNPTPLGTAVEMNVTADTLTPNGTYPIVVTATYTPTNSRPITRGATALVTVADFGLQVSPTSRQISKGAPAAYELVLNIQRGFVDPVRVDLTGLPQGATYEILMSSNTVVGGGPGTVTMTLQISTTPTVKPGTYNMTVSASGGGIVHSQNIQLIVR